MDAVTARHILEALADGLDPITRQGLGPGSPIDSPEVVSALNVALSALDHQIRRQKRDAGLPSNAGKPWSPQDDRTLSEAFDAGQSVAQTASQFGRTQDSIAARLVRIGKVPDRNTARAANRGERDVE